MQYTKSVILPTDSILEISSAVKPVNKSCTPTDTVQITARIPAVCNAALSFRFIYSFVALCVYYSKRPIIGQLQKKNPAQGRVIAKVVLFACNTLGLVLSTIQGHRRLVSN
jgi:hypothetical protein